MKSFIILKLYIFDEPLIFESLLLESKYSKYDLLAIY